jgi:DNA invertase Pin-like site-specific DNA recombinase
VAGLKHGPQAPPDGAATPNGTAPNARQSQHDEILLRQVDEARLAWHSERIKEGMTRARQRGKHIGRPRVSDSHLQRPDFIIAEALIRRGDLPPARAARELGIGYSTFRRLLHARETGALLTKSPDTSP